MNDEVIQTLTFDRIFSMPEEEEAEELEDTEGELEAGAEDDTEQEPTEENEEAAQEPSEGEG